MPKKNIIVKISDTENGEHKHETIANFEEGYVEYMESDDCTTIFNYTNKTLKRENSRLIMDATFKENEETEWLVTTKELDRTFPLKVKTTKLEIVDKNIKINYTIEGIDFSYSLEVKE
ncbi:MAG: hypothetical protein IJI22_00775 [Bacilli bacterium]|nr:hypothetical protein [Bacilli bacterium]